jgi:hypothetical protein
MASREIAMPPVPKIFTFSVKVINDNPDSVPPAIWKFRVKSSDGGGAGGPSNTTGVLPTTVTVKFDSITILEDHDGPAYNGNSLLSKPVPGEWYLVAYVQGKGVYVPLPEKVFAGRIYNFNPGQEVTVKLPENKPLSIFTVGVDFDCDGMIDIFKDLPAFFLQFPSYPFHAPAGHDNEITDLYAKLYSNPNLDWKDEINALQYRLGGYMIDSDCFDPPSHQRCFKIFRNPLELKL